MSRMICSSLQYEKRRDGCSLECCLCGFEVDAVELVAKHSRRSRFHHWASGLELLYCLLNCF